MRAAQISPIHIRAQLLAADTSAALALDVDGQSVSNTGAGRNSLSEIPDGGPAPFREIGLICNRQRIQKGSKFVHARTIPQGIDKDNTYREFTLR